MCKVTIANKARAKSVKQTNKKSGALLDLPEKDKSIVKPNQSRALGGFRKTSELKVGKDGEITGWD